MSVLHAEALSATTKGNRRRPLVFTITFAVCLIGARTPGKERFRSHDALVAPQWDGVALGALSPLLQRLKAGAPG